MIHKARLHRLSLHRLIKEHISTDAVSDMHIHNAPRCQDSLLIRVAEIGEYS